jgi:hypothetical protein
MLKMSRYPSAETVPSAAIEYALFAVWLSLSSLALGLCGWHAIAHGLLIEPVLIMIAVELPFCLPFALAAFLFRKHRLKRLAARGAFLSHLDRAAE